MGRIAELLTASAITFLPGRLLILVLLLHTWSCSTMATKIQPPVYKSCSSYEHYKVLVEAWEAVTDVVKLKQGIVIALSLQSVADSKIGERIFSSISLADLKKEDGLKTLMNFLDKELGKDDLEEVITRYDEFEDCRKQPGESMNDYISNFQQKVNRIVAKKIKLPSVVLGFKLIRGASLSKEEKILILSGINYDEPETLFEQAQRSLKKFKGEGSSSGGGASLGSSSPAIKLEPTYYTRGAYGGYRGNNARYRQAGGRGMLRGNMRGQMPFRQNTGSMFRTYGMNEGPNAATTWRGQGNGNQWKPRDAGEKSTNPTGIDGKPLRCSSCDSFRHFVRECPHSWENSGMKKVNFTQGYEGYAPEAADPYAYELSSEQMGAIAPPEEYGMYSGMNDLMLGDNYQYYQPDNEQVYQTAVLYTGGDKVESVLLQNEADQSCILDCACTSTVCGSKWMQGYVESLNTEDYASVKSKQGIKTFKFGIGLAKSVNECEIPAYIAGKRIMIKTDVVDADVPLLLSVGTMGSLGMVIDFGKEEVTVLEKTIKLNRTSSGHLSLTIAETADKIEKAYVVNLEETKVGDLKKTLLHLHKQMGHPVQEKLTTLIQDSVSWKDEYGVVLDEIYANCDRCKQFARTPSRPVVALPMARSFNEKVAMDLKYWNGRWILHLIDMFSRYTISVFVHRKDSTTILCAIIDNWIGYFGIMQGIFTDNGGEFRNDELRELGSVLNFEIKTTAAESPFQNGLCEKNHAIVDLILSKLAADYPRINVSVLLRWSNMAKNSLQMWCGFSSYQLVLGFNPRLPSIMCDPLPSMNETTLSGTLHNTLNIIHDARKAFIQSEAENKIKIALRNRIRASEAIYKKDDFVFYKREGKQQWLGPARVIFQERKVVLVDHGGFYIKVSPNRLTKVSSQYAQNKESSPESAVTDNMFGLAEVQGSEENITRNQGAASDNKKLDQPLQERLPESGAASDQEEDDFLGFSHDEGRRAEDNLQKLQQENMLNKEQEGQVYMVTLPRKRHEDPDCMKAKEIELQKLQSFSVYDEVPECGQTCISTRWILWNKGDEVRARLVARGFEEDTSRIDVDSPTVGKSTVRMLLAIASSKHWNIKSTDIKSAFLQGNALQREVYICPPKEAQVTEGLVWKLNRCLYGLNDAARQFYNSVVEEMLRLSCEKSILDPSLFFRIDSGNLSGMLVAHIDDFLHAGDQHFDEIVINQLSQRFLAGSNQEGEFRYVGYQISQHHAHGIVLDQDSYCDGVEIVKMPAEREMQKYDLLNTAELKQYRSICGSLNWLVQGSRPDLAFQLIELSTKFHCGKVEDLIKVRKIMQKARECKSEICFPDLGPVDCWRLVCYSDASHANLCEGTSSCIGYVIFILGSNNRCCPLTWKSGKARRVVKSTIAAEAMALLDGIDEALYLKKVLFQIMSLSSKQLPVIGIVDHKGLWEAVRSTKLVEDRRLRIEIASVKESLQRGEIMEIRLCSSGDMLADCLTKKGADGRKLLAVLQSGTLDLSL